MVNSISTQVWKFQRYSLVLEFESKPILPPPLILVCHLYLMIKYIIRRCQRKTQIYDTGLSEYPHNLSYMRYLEFKHLY